jgi:hypothetical protein
MVVVVVVVVVVAAAVVVVVGAGSGVASSSVVRGGGGGVVVVAVLPVHPASRMRMMKVARRMAAAYTSVRFVSANPCCHPVPRRDTLCNQNFQEPA